ncbi:NIPSNAP family protein [Nocardia sp. CDC159]|uniref:NIPSNAP family protein n=1 Tax=Nocardia pulmonis TaxID=2951408 RepID=A0A9X2IZY7_9NOCA|nr:MULTISPECIES: NIPSNAP family protein [Nocardia]MCM6777174.1 NIPSNAP family protein [Nocardia pulmonis]MCM6790059.1 NIPSNAP family protein [Nocardia sp. CDC159]
MTETLWPLLELRQYTLRPGKRDALIDLFDREFVETQESVGMRIVGQFRDEDDPDRFVWVRAFADMDSRRAALTAFYVEGQTWRTHAPAARATMLDTSNALLLHPVLATDDLGAQFVRPGPEATELPESRMLITIHYPNIPTAEFAEFFEDHVSPVLIDNGAEPLACYESHRAHNDFPALPIRDDEVFVWFSRFDTAEDLDDHLKCLATSHNWTCRLEPELSKRLAAPSDRLRLAPTARSLLH